jgi:hypothetical protein
MNQNFDPNARYNMGPNAAGCGRVSTQSQLSTPVVTVLAVGTQTVTGLSLNNSGRVATDGVVANTNVWVGPHAAGVARNNTGPNVAGAERSINQS